MKINRKKAHLTLTLAPKKWYNYTITIEEIIMKQATSENYRDQRKKEFSRKKSNSWEFRLRRATRREISRIQAWTSTVKKVS